MSVKDYIPREMRIREKRLMIQDPSRWILRRYRAAFANCVAGDACGETPTKGLRSEGQAVAG